MQTRTLGDLRKELADRLNMSSQAVSSAIQRVLNSFLREAHDNLTMQYEWPELRRDWVFPLVIGTTMYVMPTDDDSYTPDTLRIQSVYFQYNNAWLELEQGIEPWRYTVTSNMPLRRYEIEGGAKPLEVWPAPDQTYNLRIRGYAMVKPFGVPDPATGLYTDADVTACDSRLVLLMALANAKAHYGKADANVAANELNSLLGKLRAGRHGNYRYIPGDRESNPARLYVEPKWIK